VHQWVVLGLNSTKFWGNKICKLKNSVVLDIGDTSTDIGIVENGFAKRSINSSCIAEIMLNFAMPGVLSIGRNIRTIKINGKIKYNYKRTFNSTDQSIRSILDDSFFFSID
jgi:hypothetical protein